MVGLTYLAHFYVLAFVWVVISIIVTLTVFPKYIADSSNVVYITCRCVGSTILNIFTTGFAPFLKIESRFFILAMKEIIFTLTYIIIHIFLTESKIPDPMGWAYIGSDAVCAIWFVFVVFKFDFFEV